MTRWSTSQIIYRLVRGPPLPMTVKEFDWPSASFDRNFQHKHAHLHPTDTTLIDELWPLAGPAQVNFIWVSDEDFFLQLRQCVIAHTGCTGHRGLQSTSHTLDKEIY